MKDMPEPGVGPLEKDGALKSSLLEMESAQARPLMSDYMIMYSSERDTVHYRDKNGGSYLIQLLCEELRKEPKTDLETIVKRINRTIAQRVLCEDASGDASLQIPYTANLQYHLRLAN